VHDRRPATVYTATVQSAIVVRAFNVYDAEKFPAQ
jgi:hypothetical protein